MGNRGHIKTKINISSSAIIILLFSIFPFGVILFAYDKPTVVTGFIFLFVVLLCMAVYIQEKNFSSVYSWEKIEATIVSKKVIKYMCFSMYRKWNTAKNIYKIDIKYRYKYNGKIFTSNKYAMSYQGDGDCNCLYTLSEAKRRMQELTKDKTITIYVNPLNPDESVIIRDKSDNYGIPYFILFLYIASLFYLLFKIYVQDIRVGA